MVNKKENYQETTLAYSKEAQGSKPNPLVQLDPGLFIWTILTFLLLCFALAKFAWQWERMWYLIVRKASPRYVLRLRYG